MAVALRRVGAPLLFGVFPLIVLVLVVREEYASNDVAIDFHHVFYPAAQRVLDGVSPYVDVADPLQAYVYTPVLALLVAPLTAFPLGVAEVIVSVLLAICFLATPYLLGIRDWRVFGVVLLWPAFVSGLQTANVTFALCLLCALTWRWRDRSLGPGLAAGLAIGLKLFLWPLAVWLLATRRLAAFAAAALVAAASVLLVLPFESLGAFVDLVREQGEIFDGESYTVYALLEGLGAPDSVARIVWLSLGVAVLALGRRSFLLCLAAALLLSPIVWLHYFALLAVPLAVAAAPLWVWALPLLMWVVPGSGNGEPWQQALVLGVAAAVTLLCVRPAPRRSDVELEPVVRELEVVGRG